MDEQELLRRKSMVIEQYEGILPMYEAFYIQFIMYAADRAVDAFQRFDKSVSNSSSDTLVMAIFQEAMSHTAALSRFFWPKPLRKEDRALALARGMSLCKAFDLTDDSPLASRDLRNAFEHFDERLDRFLLQDLSGYFMPGPIVGPHSMADEDGGCVFKLVDPEAGICVLLGEKYEYEALASEVNRILQKAVELDKNGRFVLVNPSGT